MTAKTIVIHARQKRGGRPATVTNSVARDHPSARQNIESSDKISRLFNAVLHKTSGSRMAGADS